MGDEKPQFTFPESRQSDQQVDREIGPDGQGTFWNTVSYTPNKKSKQNSKPRKKRKRRSNSPSAPQSIDDARSVSIAQELMSDIQKQIKNEVEEGGKLHFRNK